MSGDSAPMVIIRPCRGTYVNKRGYARWLKPDIRRGAWLIRGTAQDLAYVRKRTDDIVPLCSLPPKLVEVITHQPRNDVFLSANDLREQGLKVPEIPEAGIKRWWYFFTHDDGGYGY